MPREEETVHLSTRRYFTLISGQNPDASRRPSLIGL